MFRNRSRLALFLAQRICFPCVLRTGFCVSALLRGIWALLRVLRVIDAVWRDDCGCAVCIRTSCFISKRMSPRSGNLIAKNKAPDYIRKLLSDNRR